MRLALIPGFSQPASTWAPVIDALPAFIASDSHPLEVPDGLDFVATADALGTVGGPGIYVGYSMGGRLALRLALDRPDLVHALVLVSATPGFDDPPTRSVRAEQDRARAERIHTMGVGAFLEEWLAQPLFATLPRDEAMFDQRTATMSADRLAHQMTTLGQGAMEPLGDRLSELTMPTTIVAGRADSRYVEIGRAMAARIPVATLVELDGGHALPLEQPATLSKVIARVHEATA